MGGLLVVVDAWHRRGQRYTCKDALYVPNRIIVSSSCSRFQSLKRWSRTGATILAPRRSLSEAFRRVYRSWTVDLDGSEDLQHHQHL